MIPSFPLVHILPYLLRITRFYSTLPPSADCWMFCCFLNLGLFFLRLSYLGLAVFVGLFLFIFFYVLRFLRVECSTVISQIMFTRSLINFGKTHYLCKDSLFTLCTSFLFTVHWRTSGSLFHGQNPLLNFCFSI